MCAGPTEADNDGQDHHGGHIFGPEDRLNILLPLSDAAVVLGLDGCVHSEHILIRKDLNLEALGLLETLWTAARAKPSALWTSFTAHLISLET